MPRLNDLLEQSYREAGINRARVLAERLAINAIHRKTLVGTCAVCGLAAHACSGRIIDDGYYLVGDTLHHDSELATQGWKNCAACFA